MTIAPKSPPASSAGRSPLLVSKVDLQFLRAKRNIRYMHQGILAQCFKEFKEAKKEDKRNISWQRLFSTFFFGLFFGWICKIGKHLQLASAAIVLFACSIQNARARKMSWRYLYRHAYVGAKKHDCGLKRECQFLFKFELPLFLLIARVPTEFECCICIVRFRAELYFPKRSVLLDLFICLIFKILFPNLDTSFSAEHGSAAGDWVVELLRLLRHGVGL